MIQDTISSQQARRFYNRLGHRYDWAALFESTAKAQALERLALQPGLAVLDAGAGTGREFAIIQKAVEPDGLAVGVDASFVMADLASRQGGATCLCADASRLPFKPDTFDRIYVAYLMDLLPLKIIEETLAGLRNILGPDGRMVILSLTDGVDFLSKGLVAGWKAIYRVAPLACGGCRPLHLGELVEAAGLRLASLEVITQWGIPSELAVAVR